MPHDPSMRKMRTGKCGVQGLKKVYIMCEWYQIGKKGIGATGESWKEVTLQMDRANFTRNTMYPWMNQRTGGILTGQDVNLPELRKKTVQKRI